MVINPEVGGLATMATAQRFSSIYNVLNALGIH